MTLSAGLNSNMSPMAQDSRAGKGSPEEAEAPGNGQLSPSAGELAPSCRSKRMHVFGFLNPFNKAGEHPVSFKHRGLADFCAGSERILSGQIQIPPSAALPAPGRGDQPF